MLIITDRYVIIMALLRVFSGMVEFAAACMMIKFGKVAYALRWNALPAMVGPTVLILVTLIGVAGVAGKISLLRIALIMVGVILIMIGTQNVSS